jgi:hypothetical protein
MYYSLFYVICVRFLTRSVIALNLIYVLVLQSDKISILIRVSCFLKFMWLLLFVLYSVALHALVAFYSQVILWLDRCDEN